jgi:hypothetical protein
LQSRKATAMGYYNDLSLGDTHTADDDYRDHADYRRVVALAAPRTPAPAISVDQELVTMGLRLAGEDEAGWYVTISGRAAVWATDAPAPTPTPVSDLSIPPALDILARAADLRRDYQRQHDASAVKALNAIIATVVCDYDVLSWDGPYLAVASESEVGKAHQVSAFGCSCEARRPCYHMRLRELLIGLMETEAETMDMEASNDEDGTMNDEGSEPAASSFIVPSSSFVARLFAARSVRYASL